MSALRLSRPGYPTELRVIDDGAVGRVTHTRSGIRGSIGGVLVTPVRPPKHRPDAAKYRLANQEQINARRRESRARVKARKEAA